MSLSLEVPAEEDLWWGRRWMRRWRNCVWAWQVASYHDCSVTSDGLEGEEAGYHRWVERVVVVVVAVVGEH